MPLSLKANKKVNDPDLPSFDEAMHSHEKAKWLEAMQKEIDALTEKGTWEEVPESQAKTKILPTTWVLKVKRNPEGEATKFKARICVRGDLEEKTDESTYAPVASWTTVRLFLVTCLALGWYTCSVDFSNAFVQAYLKHPVWIHVPRGYSSTVRKDVRTVLRLKKSLYGLTAAPRLWYELLLKSLLEEGFVQSKIDPCLLLRKDMMIVFYVDDAGIAAKSKDTVDKLVARLREKGFELTQEGSFSEFLGIKFDNLPDGSIHMTQKGLIKKIIAATGMEDCKGNFTPQSTTPLGSDPDGEPMREDWSMRSIVGMLLYLSTNSRPDIAFAVSQVARFSNNPKQSHATAIKTIVRYLSATHDKGTIIRPTKHLSVDCYVDADFAGLYGHEPDGDPVSVKSRTGYIIFVGNCPCIWKSQLQSETSLSTAQSEYVALSSAMRVLIPLRAMILEINEMLDLPNQKYGITCRVFEDNNACRILATEQKLSNRTKHYLVKYHHFWEQVKNGNFGIFRIDTHLQKADYFTKGLVRELFQNNRHSVQGW